MILTILLEPDLILCLTCNSGFDLKGLLERVHASPRVVGPMEKAMASPWGTLAAAYLMCKLISPLRYVVTLLGMRFTCSIRRTRTSRLQWPLADGSLSLSLSLNRHTSYSEDVRAARCHAARQRGSASRQTGARHQQVRWLAHRNLCLNSD